MLEKLLEIYPKVENFIIDNGYIGNNDMGMQMIYGFAIVTGMTMVSLIIQDIYMAKHSKRD